MTSKEFADFMLKEAGVSVVPGHVFGDYGGGYVRLCYVNSVENIKKVIEKMQTAFKKDYLSLK